MPRIEFEREFDGRRIAEIPALPCVMSSGKTKADARAELEALALRAPAVRLENGEAVPELAEFFVVAAWRAGGVRHAPSAS